jgi:pyrroline-5-carboxylate reductase
MKLGIIGGGMMGEAILSGILSSSFLKKENILVSEPLEDRRKYLTEKYEIEVVSDNVYTVNSCEYILLAIKPQNFKEVLQEISPHIKSHHVIISIAAGIPISLISKYTKEARSIIRVMPNLPCTVNKGAIAITYSEAKEEDIKFTKSLFETIGKVWILPEKYFDTVTALTGSGPAFVALILQGFTLSGVKGGIPYDISREMVIQLFEGVLEYIKSKNLTFEDIIRMTSSPAGTTIMGLEVLYNERIIGIIMNAITSSKNRGSEITNEIKEGLL